MQVTAGSSTAGGQPRANREGPQRDNKENSLGFVFGVSCKNLIYAKKSSFCLLICFLTLSKQIDAELGRRFVELSEWDPKYTKLKKAIDVEADAC